MTPSRRLILRSVAVAILAGLAAFAAIALLHAALPRLAPFDAAIQAAIHARTNPGLTAVMRALTFIGSIQVFIPTLIAAVILLLLVGEREQGIRLVRKRHVSTLFAIGVGGALVLNGTFKAHFHRARPRVPWAIGDEHTFSFPSGHSLFSFVLYGLIAYSVLTRRDPLLRRLAVTLGCAAMVLGIGLSRIYLGMHWPTDVLAGYLTGAIWLSATLAIDRLWRAEFARSRAGLGHRPGTLT
jgi:undecaprenyl-diphosphatase